VRLSPLTLLAVNLISNLDGEIREIPALFIVHAFRRMIFYFFTFQIIIDRDAASIIASLCR
jgi:hypothetical protein